MDSHIVRRKRKATSPAQGGGKRNHLETQWECPYCQKQIKYKSMPQHLRIHEGSKVQCPAEHCPNQYAREDNLTKHWRSYHSHAPKRCRTCDTEFDSITNLARHIRKDHPLPDKVAFEEPEFITIPEGPPLPDESVDADMNIINQLHEIPEPARPYIQNNWRLIRTYANEQRWVREYNMRLIGNETGERVNDYFADRIHPRQTTGYKVVASAGYLLEEKKDDGQTEYRVFTPHVNNFNIIVPPLDHDEETNDNDEAEQIAEKDPTHGARPFTITNPEELNHFIKHLDYQSIVNSITRPNTKCRLVALLNVQFWVYPLERPIGCGKCKAPDHIMNINKEHLENFLLDESRHRHQDHLCVFRIICHVLDNGDISRLNVHRCLKEWLTAKYGDGPAPYNPQNFPGVNLSELGSLEELYNVRFHVYQKQEDGIVYLIRRSPPHPTKTVINVDIQQMENSKVHHFSLIKNLNRYGGKFFCPFCGDKMSKMSNLMRHHRTCSRGKTKLQFPGGVHKEMPNIFKMLLKIGITIPKNVPLYYPMRATYDFESKLIDVKSDNSSGRVVVQDTDSPSIICSKENQPIVADKHRLPTEEPKTGTPPKLQFFQVHSPISFSVISNVPGYTSACTQIETDPKKLIELFIDYLMEMGNAAKDLMHKNYKNIIEQVKALLKKANQDYEERKEKEQSTHVQSIWRNKVKNVSEALDRWLDQLPIIGFNSGKYDIPLIKEYLYPGLVEYALSRAAPKEISDYDKRMASVLKIKRAKKSISTAEEEDDEEEESIDGSEDDEMEDDFIEDEDDEECDASESEYSDDSGLDMEVDDYINESHCHIKPVPNDPENTEEESVVAIPTNPETLTDKPPATSTSPKKLPPENPPPRIKGMPVVIKQGRSILALITETLKFLDMSKYLAAGTSLDQFITAWMKSDQCRHRLHQPEDIFGMITMKKLPFPYQFLNSDKKLDHEGIPPQSSFYNQLKGKPISDQDYSKVQEIYRVKKIKTFKEYLKLYNEVDVIPFLQAVNKQFTQYFDQTGVDVFKECLSLPGITLKYIYNKTDKYQFALWKPKDKALYEGLRRDRTGGLSIVMKRRCYAGETIIRESEIVEGSDLTKFYKVCSILGLDFNALYLWCMGQDMPSGFHSVWKFNEEDGKMLKDHEAQPIAQQWLEYTSHKIGHQIITKHTHGFEERIGPVQIPVDGYCVANNTVYEFLGCYWHCHGKCSCKFNNPTDINPSNHKTSKKCLEELTERKKYVESLGMKFEYIWECDWLAQKKANNEIWEVLCKKNRKWFTRKTVTHDDMKDAITDGSVFGFCEVDLETPAELQKLHHFQDFPPIIKNAMVGRDDCSPHMKALCEKFELLEQPRKCLISSFTATKQWFLTSMVEYLVSKGLKLNKVHSVIQYDRSRPFQWFVEDVTKARQAADEDPAMEILGLAKKLIGNTGYGKYLTEVTKHQNVYVVPEAVAKEIVHDPFMVSMERLGDTENYEVVLHKRVIKHNLPEQVGIAVYNYAKIKMLQFAYDFLGEFCDPYKYEWCQTDTDSAYLALAGSSIRDIVKPNMLKRFDDEKDKWFVIDTKKDKRTPGLLKEEYTGTRMICLSSKTYIVVNDNDNTSKCAHKGVQAHNNFVIDQYEKVLLQGLAGIGYTSCGFNTGFQKTPSGQIGTYIAERAALTYIYAKRFVEKDGISTRPIDK